jgi:hypothetical protein
VVLSPFFCIQIHLEAVDVDSRSSLAFLDRGIITHPKGPGALEEERLAFFKYPYPAIIHSQETYFDSPLVKVTVGKIS